MPAKDRRKASFCQVLIPKDIATQLDESYGKEFANTSANVYNLLNSKEKYLVNGIYAFKGQGPHFPRKIFIYRNKEIFFFRILAHLIQPELLKSSLYFYPRTN